MIVMAVCGAVNLDGYGRDGRDGRLEPGLDPPYLPYPPYPPSLS